eukprot:TRINITY_DN11989_c0_g1_i1.p1 TRINITY_DN11989_c0_g1~~TRINITY_DN11989_c0_g1_i1.p1  ORF type:complete len:247 (-),score=44.44 TRINITY_DN11989_c0_g1_i1:11-751(-)
MILGSSGGTAARLASDTSKYYEVLRKANTPPSQVAWAVKELSSVGIEPQNAIVVFSACARLAWWRDALGLMNRMIEQQAALNGKALSAVVNACARDSQWQQALCVVEELKRLHVESDAANCYNAATNACARRGLWRQALAVLEGMQENMQEADTIGHNAAISACSEGGEWQLAICVFASMAEKRIEANLISYRGVRTVGRGLFGVRYDFFASTKNCASEPLAVVLNALGFVRLLSVLLMNSLQGIR